MKVEVRRHGRWVTIEIADQSIEVKRNGKWVSMSGPEAALPRPNPRPSASRAKNKRKRKYKIFSPPSPPPVANEGLIRLFSGEEPPPVRSAARTKPKQPRKRQKQFWCPKCVKRQRNEYCEFHGSRNEPLTPSLKATVGPARREPYHGSVRHPYQGGLPD